MTDEPTERDVTTEARQLSLDIARDILRSDWYAESIAEARREGAAEALEAWIAEWPTTPGDGTFLADIARAGLDRAEALRGDA